MGSFKVPQVGQTAPDFHATAVFEEDFVRIRLSDYRHKKYVIVFFYPLDFTFVCPTEIIAFSDRFEEFSSLGAEILGISIDSEYSHLAWLQTHRENGGLGRLNYPLISDITKEVSRGYNVLLSSGVALRGLFIVDKEGVIQYSSANNLSFGRSVDETLRILQAIQYVQQSPDEVCPADWNPGDETINITNIERPLEPLFSVLENDEC
uniref:Thioredoxin domain-containing protein n=1 Tax=Ishige okamurae TaxID=233772 RepID=A0A8E5XRD7_9PHAE|nr:hypothetical protein Ycf42 [Ishige okamurae]QVJ99593.1 hypothetical protein Ycf42 [Ishige okamurae]WAM64025.1 putative peroxiredoxin Ycf42 [Ishige okamurae]